MKGQRPVVIEVLHSGGQSIQMPDGHWAQLKPSFCYAVYIQ